MKKQKISPVMIVIVMIIISVTVVFVRCNSASGNATVAKTAEPAVNDSLAFGDTKWISDGLKGKIYFLPENTDSLPDFDTLESVGTIFTHELNIPNRSWSTGFPGVPNRTEWFGIEYKGNFIVNKPGHYTFRLVADDGAKLFIDGKLVINNDGLHPERSESGEVDLDASEHSIRVQYYQGPRYNIALQLFATFDHENEEQVFPGKNIQLITPGSGHSWWIWVLIVLLICAVVYAVKKYNA
ncbi:MAG TPA: PA14 domain-containing protein [Ferruginibacter sp.]|nr:PA14 domain-containing protein [Ferruginibacter sp.]